MDDLTKLLSTLMTPTYMAEARAEAMRSFERDLSTRTPNLRAMPPDPSTDYEFSIDFENFGPAQYQSLMEDILVKPLQPKRPLITSLPCANVQAEKYFFCKKPGTRACSACKLVSYCSQVAKKNGCLLYVLLNDCFRSAKKPTGSCTSKVRLFFSEFSQIINRSNRFPDCKNPMRSGNWEPIWIRERRRPSFITSDNETEAKQFQRIRKEEFSVGMTLHVFGSFIAFELQADDDHEKGGAIHLQWM